MLTLCGIWLQIHLTLLYVLFVCLFVLLEDLKKKLHGTYDTMNGTKVLFTDHCRRQKFRPSLLGLADRLYTVIHKTQKTRTKVLPSATDGE